MKKKLITSMLALTCAATCAVVFAACNNDPKKVKGDEVTAEQWAEAFKEDNFKNVKIEAKYTVEDFKLKEDGSKEPFKYTMKTSVVIVDGVQYQKSEATVDKGPQELKDEMKEMNSEKYSSVSEGKYTIYYTNKDGKWRQVPGKRGVVDGYIKQYTAMATQYDKYEYEGGWAKGYRLKADYAEFGQDRLVYKIKSNKLSVVYYENEGEHDVGDPESHYSVKYEYSFTYGKQSLTLPTVETSSYTGTWKTEKIVADETTYNLNDPVEAWGNLPLTADTVKVELKNDGTGTSVNPGGEVSGTWVETDDGICFTTDDGQEYDCTLNGTNLIVDMGMTIYLKKA